MEQTKRKGAPPAEVPPYDWGLPKLLREATGSIVGPRIPAFGTDGHFFWTTCDAHRQRASGVGKRLPTLPVPLQLSASIAGTA